MNNFINFLCPHPYRSKGSQWGGEKQHNKMFPHKHFYSIIHPTLTDCPENTLSLNSI